MATSGKVNTTAYDSRYIEFAWSRQSYSVANNTTTISWTLTARGSGQYSQYNAAPFEVKIDGMQVYYSSTRITTTNGLQITSGTHTFNHNANGTKSFSVSVSAAIYTFAVNCTGSGSFTLDTIPRAATLNSAPNFNDEQNPTITYSNPAGSSVTKLEACISSDNLTDDICYYREISKTGNSYTFTLTAAEKERLYNVFNNRKTTETWLYFGLRTTIGSTTYYKSITKESCTLINCSPTIDGFSIVHLTDSVMSATGHESWYCKYVSDADYSFSTTALKGATITSYSTTIGSYSSNTKVGTVFNIDGNEFVFTATDSRGETVTERVPIYLIDYVPITCEATGKIELTDETTAQATITISGNFYNANFGAEDNKLGIKILYTGIEDWLEISDLVEPVIDGNRYTVEIPVYLAYDSTFTYSCFAYDLMGNSNTISNRTLKLNPVFDWSSSDFNFNVPVSINNMPINDFVVQQGTSNEWYYRLWNSGRAECFKVKSFSTEFTQAWGNMYQSNQTIANDSYPITFKGVPVELVSVGGGISYAAWIFAQNGGRNNTTQSGIYKLCRPTKVDAVSTFWINYAVFGYWK